MKTLNQVRSFATSLSLIILALGFSALGLVRFMNPQPSATGIVSAENAYSFVGSSFSILIGAAFLLAAICFTIVRSKSESAVAQFDVSLSY
jgi:hypothetical protein